MIIPIRCFSCGRPIAHLYEQFTERISKGEVEPNLANMPKSVQRELLIEESYKNSAKEEIKELVKKISHD